MAVRVAINGFGRIGRLVYRALVESGRTDVEVVAINDLGSADANAHLLKYDSAHGILPADVSVDGDALVVNGTKVKVVAERDPAALPWADMGVHVALECTGLFTDKAKASAHLTAGAKRVLVSAPAKEADATIVMGVNHDTLKPEHAVVSNGSCTTNCLAPVADVLLKEFGIVNGFMSTVHSYTGDQRTVDTLHKDLRRARAAAANIIPTSTGAAKALGLVIPELSGKLDGVALRVPTPNVSLIDLKVVTEKPTDAAAVNAAMRAAAEGRLKGVLGINDAPLVSGDFNHNPNSSTFDTGETKVIGGNFVRVLSWYDNEWGFSNRMLDTVALMGSQL